jgi:hypothetical protein
MDDMCNIVIAALAIVFVEDGHPLTVHCSESGTVMARFASSINLITSIDEVEGVDVDGSMSMASFRELIFTSEDGAGDGFCKEAFLGSRISPRWKYTVICQSATHMGVTCLTQLFPVRQVTYLSQTFHKQGLRH